MKEKICGIYCIENISTSKKYIGQSTDILYRWNKHKTNLNGNYHPNMYLQSSWNKYGESDFVFSILEECNMDELDERESYWIDYYNTVDRTKGFNLRDGGQNGGSKYSDESRKKMSESQKELWTDEQHKRHMSEAFKNVWSNDDYRNGRSGENHPMYGKHHSEETKKKISKINKGKKKPPRSKEHCKALSLAKLGKESSNKNTTPVRCIELNVVFNDAITAGRKLNIKCPNHVIDVCKGRRQTCGGYHFEFVDNIGK